jgi:hypothetical protein
LGKCSIRFVFNAANPNWDSWARLFGIDWLDWKLFTVLPIWLLVVLISIIAIWIGYSMLTTPAPVPLEAMATYRSLIEKLEEELAAEEEAE